MGWLVMKKIISILLILSMCVLCAACGTEEAKQSNLQPDTSQMKSICELATMDCYFHNVAKYNEEDASGILWWKKDRKFWIEYAGIVTIGVDVSRVDMDIDGDVVTITMPPAKVLGCKVNEATLTEDSFIVANDSAKIEAEHQTAAFQEAQSKMQQDASEDTILLANAQQRAQELLEGYVKNIGGCVGREYQIKWKYLDDEPKQEN